MGIFKDCGCGCNGAKAQEKLVISLMSALIFFVVANPQTFILMRRILVSGLPVLTVVPSSVVSYYTPSFSC